MSEYVRAAGTAEIPEGSAKCVTVQGKNIAIFHSGENFYALDDTCTHAGGPLSEGRLEGTQVECPWHGACFDLKTGAALAAPAFEGVHSYPVRVSGLDVQIEL